VERIKMNGILGTGVYIPLYRIRGEEYRKAGLSGAFEEKSVPRPDEDVITMGVECMKNLPASDKLEALYFASPGLGERWAPSILVDALGLSPRLRAIELTGPKAVTSALSLKHGKTILLASDIPSGKVGEEIEQELGAGAGALLLGEGESIARIGESASFTQHIGGGRFTQNGMIKDLRLASFERIECERIVAEVTNDLLERTGRKMQEYRYVVASAPSLTLIRRLSRKLNLAREQIVQLITKIGYTGISFPLLCIISALENSEPGDKILVLSYAPGGSADALEIEMERKVKQKKLEYYLGRKKYIDFPTYLRWKKVI
jgi:3-hydroxy-3-methylglutaryl CoA synthase